jgi:hypothetical protein
MKAPGGKKGPSGKKLTTISIRVAAVRFGPVQHDILLNLGPDHRSGSANLLNLGPDLPEPVGRVRRVRFKVQRHLNREPDLCDRFFNHNTIYCTYRPGYPRRCQDADPYILIPRVRVFIWPVCQVLGLYQCIYFVDLCTVQCI